MIILVNRNSEAHFSLSPGVDIGRSRMEIPFNHTFDMDFGDLVPFFCQEILPGDTVSLDTSKVVRTSTLLDPVMGSAYFDVYYFFVPMRLVWQHTREFFGENTSGPWYPETSYSIPQMTTNSANKVFSRSILDHLGVPPEVEGLSFSALPCRAYNLVWSEWFRDPNVQSPANVYLGDSSVLVSSAPSDGGRLRKVCKLHDYFTSCLPGPQRGPAVHVPISGTIPINFNSSSAPVITTQGVHQVSQPIRFSTGDGNYFKVSRIGQADTGLKEVALGNFSGGSTSYDNINATNLIVNIPSATGNLDGASPITINDLRLAFAMQKWYERGALYGGRYVEYLKGHFGVTSPDGRLQRTEYLGGNRIPINVQQVEQTSEGETPLGHLGAFSHTSDVNSDFTHSFVEHGFLLGLCCARVNRVYAQGLAKMWTRKTVFEFYDPLFANLGNTPVYRREIYATGTTDDDNVFGFQEAWADYRYAPDRVSGSMRPQAPQSLASWNYADYYTEPPILSSGWIEEDKNVVDRTLAVTSSQAAQIICDIHVDEVMVRPMPVYSVPGLIDHH